MNVFSEYIYKDRNLHDFTLELIKDFKNNDNILLYSPAHMEEVALILSQNEDISLSKRYIKNIICSISTVTNNYECLPTEKEILIKLEHPEVCYKRVIDCYTLTTIAELNESIGVRSKHQNIDGTLEKYNVNRSRIGSIEPENLFANETIQNLLVDFLKDNNVKIKKWNEIKNSHESIQGNISIIFDFLESIGYKTDGVKQYRSMMHDVTHAIYGTISDIFITNDKNFFKRIKAIYSYFEIPVKVLFLNDLAHTQERRL